MKSLKYLAVILNILISVQIFAQKKTVSGYVYDENTGEKLIGTTVYDLKSKNGTVTNNYGFFSLTFPKQDTILLQISFIGYQKEIIEITQKADAFLQIKLKQGTTMQEIKVYGTRTMSIDKRNEMSVVEIPVDHINSLPALGGEPDIMKALQLMPGVQSGNEGTSGIYVRGGSPDQNLVLLDDVPLYYVSHLGGFVSVFNADAINNVKLSKGGFPARYGGRLSSVLDIRMKEGNMQKIKGSGMVGLVASKISVEGPLIKDKASFIVSGRRFLLDILARPIINLSSEYDETFGYNFYDLNAKVNYKISEKDRIYFSLYSGDDKVFYRFDDDYDGVEETMKEKLKWGNTLEAIRWNHVFSPKLFSNTMIAHTRYRNKAEFKMEVEDNYGKTKVKESFFSGIEDLNGKIDFEYYPVNNYTLRFGLNSIYHTFKPDIQKFKETSDSRTIIDSTFNEIIYHSWEHSIYLENEKTLFDLITFNIGAHASIYSMQEKTYHSFEPRVLCNARLAEHLSFKASYAMMKQYVHLLAYSGTGMPSDLWMPSTSNVPPSNSTQYAAGIAKSFNNSPFEISLEAYYKEMDNLIAYKEGASHFFNTENWQDKIEKEGTGTSKGIEFLIQKKEGKTTGWIGYTLSSTTRTFENLNNGKTYPFKYDRRHDIGATLSHKLNEKVNLSAAWVYGTGNPITLQSGQYYLIGSNVPYNIQDGQEFPTDAYSLYVVELFGEKNSFRMRAYHRLDLGINFTKKKKWGERTWNLSVYNAYNRKNPFFYFWDYDYDESTTIITGAEKKLYQQSLFPIIPSVSYSFKF